MILIKSKGVLTYHLAMKKIETGKLFCLKFTAIATS
jgi:hypothetical protein